MKSFEELKARYNSIPELPVSEEMLCARSEGRLSPMDEMLIDSEISQDSRTRDLVNEISESKSSQLVDLDDWITSQDISHFPEITDVPSVDDPFESFKLNTYIENENYLLTASSAATPDDFFSDHDVLSQQEDIFKEDDFFSDDNDILSNNPDSFDLDDTDMGGIDLLDDF